MPEIKKGFPDASRSLYMKIMKHIFIVLLLFCTALPCHADQAETIGQVEKYLNNLKTAKARFVQTTHDGNQLVGTFYLKRPGKLKFEYDDPVEDFVVADGLFIYFYDSELGEQTNAPIGQTLADFILRKDLELSGDVKVQSVKRAGQYLQIALVQADDPAGGSLVLAFDEDPMKLKKWRVIDPQGLITEIELFYLETDISFKDSFFAYIAPKSDEVRFNE